MSLNSRKKPLASSIAAHAINYPTKALVKWYTSHQTAAGGGVIATSLDAGASPLNTNICTSTTVANICSWTTAPGDTANCTAYLKATAPDAQFRCDRTVMYDPNQTFFGFPLQADDQSITNMLTSDMLKDQNYSCNFSVNSNPNKVNTSQPNSACCGVIRGTSLLSPLPVNGSGHMEPYLNPAVPNIRFCGNTVE